MNKNPYLKKYLKYTGKNQCVLTDTFAGDNIEDLMFDFENWISVSLREVREIKKNSDPKIENLLFLQNTVPEQPVSFTAVMIFNEGEIMY